MARFGFIISSFFLLFACANTETLEQKVPQPNEALPQIISLNPLLPEFKPLLNTFAPFELEVRDYRPANYIVSIADGDKVAVLIRNQQSIRSLVKKRLNQGLLEQGKVTLARHDNQLVVDVVKLLTEIEQDPNQFTLTTQVQLHATLLVNDQVQLTKQFKSQQVQTRINLTPEDLNQGLDLHLSNVLQQIIRHTELYQPLVNKDK
ncbi:YajG family lipoprotein [Motilimonas pumila]|uniref:Uncharacterized protein n=1 Tax=Motilimonas pumila TaxID=2303987 RepID=A0A418YJV3_9GAMM|nr:YajG family lipoprotein [Motilimonas pumila]RJG51261.1 hypothetical protein D1Z90_00560 [Motilimonas pumila]